MSLLPKLNLNEVKVQPVEKVTANAIIGPIGETPTQSGGVFLKVPLYYADPNLGELSLEDLQATAEVLSVNEFSQDIVTRSGLRTFLGSIFVRPEWFDADFSPEDGDRAYQINFAGTVRKLFKAVNAEEIDFDSLPGTVVRFTAGPNSKEVDRLELKGFYPAK